jgi:hypothetical protein
MRVLIKVTQNFHSARTALGHYRNLKSVTLFAANSERGIPVIGGS